MVANGKRGVRGVLARVALAAFAASIAVAAAEALLQLTGRAPDPGLFTVTAREYARVPGIFAPGQVVTEAAGTRFEHTTRINALGYRGSEIPTSPGAEELRVLHVGDSFTWGHNVADDSTTPAALQRQLAALCGLALVINAGLPGSTIAGQDEMVRRGLVLGPDLVLLTYHENDIDELIHSRVWEQLAENRRVKSRFPVSLVYPVVRSTAIWNLLQRVRRSRVPYVPQSADLAPAAADTGIALSSAVISARTEYRERLIAVRDTLAARGVPFAYALFPHPNSVRVGRGARDYAWARENAQDLGLLTLDLLDTLQQSGEPLDELFLLPEDYHPSPRGHAVAAAYLAPRLLSKLPAGACVE